MIEERRWATRALAATPAWRRYGRWCAMAWDAHHACLRCHAVFPPAARRAQGQRGPGIESPALAFVTEFEPLYTSRHDSRGVIDRL